jgi:DNA repair protein RadC
LIDAYGSVGGVLAEPREHVRALTNDRVARLTSATADTLAHSLRQRLFGRVLDGTDDQLADYLITTMADLDHEQLRVLFLDRGNHLIGDEVISSGSVSRLATYPRLIVRRAIARNACALILIHNHPGGRSEPSLADLEGTQRLCDLAAALDIVLHDHLVVCGNIVTSMRARGLL